MVNDTRNLVHGEALTWVSQANAMWDAIKDSGLVTKEDFWANNPYLTKVTRLYEEDFQLAKLTDESDLLFHAEGPGAGHESPRLDTVNWLGVRMERRLRELAQSLTPLVEADARVAARKLDLRLTGIAPGSLYMGIALAEIAASLPGMEASDLSLVQSIRSALQSIQVIPQFVTDVDVSSEIMDAFPDPALRDALIVAAFEIAPTGRKGIHTLEISAPRTSIRTGTLGQRERVVLREATSRPFMKERRRGSFVGQVREIDLDSSRFQLRGVEGVGTLRCVSKFDENLSKRVLGRTISVSGWYDVDRDGRPRLMEVSEYNIHPAQTQRRLPRDV
ncbi:hypothetical protein ACM1PE_08840 [Achromobacter sp. PD1]|uniref:hypothetical protein n=1 Tax=Achromobacter sp. PD1 TaxID=3399125 RepID=UPI003AF5510F